MKKEKMWRIKYIKLLEILNQESDVDRPLSTTTLIKKLAERDVHVDRKVLYEDIKVLNATGYEVKLIKKKQNFYYIPKREFDIPELRIIIDAIEASTFISEEKTNELIDKVATLSGSYRKKLLLRYNNYFDANKHTNEEVYISVNEIEEAINRKVKLEFKYFDLDINATRIFRKKDRKIRTYKVDPVATIYSNDNYYLVTYSEKYDSYVNYRIDRMANVKRLEECRLETSKIESFDISAYRKKMFGMYNGEVEQVTLEFDKDLTEVIFDKFGESTKLIEGKQTNTCTVEVAISPQFFGYLLGLGTKIKLTSPETTVLKFIEYVDKIRENF